MAVNDFDSYRPPREPRPAGSKKGRKKRRRGAGAADGSREERMVPNAEFTSYYGKPVVKAPPWEWPIATYLFLGGVAGGSSLLGAGAMLTGRSELKRNARIATFGAAALGSLALIDDLGRPLRALNMFRVLKASSPMSWGSWLLASFSTAAAVSAVHEIDELTGRKLPLPGVIRGALCKVAGPAAVGSAALGAPLSVYTAVLFSTTSVPAWNEAKSHLSYLFASSASAAAGGLAMVTCSVDEARPARALAVMGACGEIAVTKVMHSHMDPVSVEPYEQGKPGAMLKAAEALTVAGGVGALVIGGHRIGAAASGVALMAASCLTRFGVMHAGLESTKDPKYVVDPQARRLAERQAQGDTADSIVTVK